MFPLNSGTLFYMDELIDIVTQDGAPTGESALKSVIHMQGYYHNTAHVWLYTKKGQILLQQRALSKSICPGLWDVSVAGHVDAGETIEQGAVRETFEEIGLKIAPHNLNKIGVFKCFQSYPNGVVDNEFHHTYISPLEVSLDHLKPCTDEVEALKLISITDFMNLLENSLTNGHFIAANKAYYLSVIKAISNQVQE